MGTAALQTRSVSFESGGNRLAASLFSQADQRTDSPCIVLCQGNTGVRSYSRFGELATRLAKAGFEVLSFDYRGFGESAGPRGRFIPTELVQDVRAAITTVTGRADRPVGLFGSGVGGAIAAAAAVDERVRGLVTLVAPFDCGRWIRSLHRYWEWRLLCDRIDRDRIDRRAGRRSALIEIDDVLLPSPSVLRQRQAVPGRLDLPAAERQMTLESVERLLELQPEKETARSATVPLLIMHAENSELVPVDEAHSMWRAHSGPKRFVLFKNAQHHDVFAGRLFDRAVEEGASWFADYLSRDETRASTDLSERSSKEVMRVVSVE